MMQIELGPEPSSTPTSRWNDGVSLSDDERTRRWQIIGDIIAAGELDAVVIFASNADSYLRYAEWASKGIFRTSGSVVLRRDGATFAFGIADSSEPWIRNGSVFHDDFGQLTAECIASSSTSLLRIGTVGAHRGAFGLNEFTSQGLATSSMVKGLQENLPGAVLIDVTADLARAMLVKSDEEIKLIEAAAAMGERLQEHLLEAVLPGLTFRQCKSIAVTYAALNDFELDVLSIEFPRPVIHPGDVVNTEFGVRLRGGYAQVTMAVAIGEPSVRIRELADVADHALGVADRTARAGITFGELADAIQDEIDQSGFWHGFPVVHSLAPLTMVGRLALSEPASPKGYLAANGADEILRDGMALSLEVGARSGPVDQVKIGGTVILEAGGARHLNELGRRLRVRN